MYKVVSSLFNFLATTEGFVNHLAIGFIVAILLTGFCTRNDGGAGFVLVTMAERVLTVCSVTITKPFSRTF